MIDLTVDMRQYDCPFIDTTDDHEVAFATSHWEFNQREEVLETRMIVEGPDRSELESGLSALRNHQNMNDFNLLTKRDGAARIRTVIEQTEAMETIRRNDGYITGPFYIEDGSETWHVGFDEREHTDATLSELERDTEFSVLSREDTTLPEMADLVRNAGAAMTLVNGCRDLSETERETLETAVNTGYYDNPRSSTLGDLADEFDVSKPAASQNLRRAERKMVERVIDVLSDIE